MSCRFGLCFQSAFLSNVSAHSFLDFLRAGRASGLAPRTCRRNCSSGSTRPAPLIVRARRCVRGFTRPATYAPTTVGGAAASNRGNEPWKPCRNRRIRRNGEVLPTGLPGRI